MADEAPQEGPAGSAQRTGKVQLGKYVLDAPLGMGGMAEVFRGHTVGAEGFERPVAIKRVLPDASRNPAFAAMFVSEAKLSARLQHPNVVSVLDFDRDHEGRLYLVMELVEGKDLDGIIESGRLPFSVVIYAVTEVLRGLGYAHDLPAGADGVRGLVHRDISPHNVLCAWSGAVKVSDFGIAKARAATSASASVTIKGKPAYMSPEQINGAPLDGRSDLFAVGVMLWQMLTGQYLFASGTTSETLARVLFGNVTPPRALVPDAPADLEAVTLKLLAKDPAHRYQTADEAIDDLLRCQHAPRDGRRELEALLVERFPDKAPVRPGQRSRSGATPAPSAPRTPAQAAAMSAPTRTADAAPSPVASSTAPTVAGRVAPMVPPALAAAPRHSSRAGLLAIGLLAVGLLGAVALIVVLAVARGGGGATAPGESPSSAVGAASRDAPVDTAVAPDADGLVDAGPLIDAGPPIDARSRRREPARGSGSSQIREIPIP